MRPRNDFRSLSANAFPNLSANEVRKRKDSRNLSASEIPMRKGFQNLSAKEPLWTKDSRNLLGNGFQNLLENDQEAMRKNDFQNLLANNVFTHVPNDNVSHTTDPLTGFCSLSPVLIQHTSFRCVRC